MIQEEYSSDVASGRHNYQNQNYAPFKVDMDMGHRNNRPEGCILESFLYNSKGNSKQVFHLCEGHQESGRARAHTHTNFLHHKGPMSFTSLFTFTYPVM